MDADALASRAAVEKFFVSNSFAFFVGWTWNIVFRNLFSPISDAAGNLAVSLDFSRFTGEPIPEIS